MTSYTRKFLVVVGKILDKENETLNIHLCILSYSQINNYIIFRRYICFLLIVTSN